MQNKAIFVVSKQCHNKDMSVPVLCCYVFKFAHTQNNKQTWKQTWGVSQVRGWITNLGRLTQSKSKPYGFVLLREWSQRAILIGGLPSYSELTYLGLSLNHVLGIPPKIIIMCIQSQTNDKSVVRPSCPGAPEQRTETILRDGFA